MARVMRPAAIMVLAFSAGSALAVMPQLATSDSHTLALKADGTLWAWGISDSGQLGTGDFEPGALPTWVGEGFVAV